VISFSSVLGIVLGFALLAFSIHRETDNWQIYASSSSLLIVLGGTLTVTLIGYRAKYAWSACLQVLKIYLHQPITPKSLVGDVGTVVGWSSRVQAEGAMALDSIARESKDEFVRYIFQLASTGYSTEDIRTFGETSIEEHYFRRLQESHILNSMGSTTPALGLVGTLIGLITMLSRLEDPSKLGPGLALALTATLYGLLFARFVFLPSSTKAKQTLSIERFRQYLILEGLILLMEKRPTLYVQDRLNSFLDRRNQYSPAPR
jgi:chemotaxis protein MotA